MLAISLCVLVLMLLSGLIVWLLTSGAKPPVPPQIIHVPTPVAAPPPAAPYVDMVRVRYHDAKGHVIAEQSIPRRNRRPQMTYTYKHHRSVFLASHALPDGTWVYRFQSED